MTVPESAAQVLISQASGDRSADDGLSSLTAGPLKVGAKGEAVSAIQRRLKLTNHYKGPIDGVYGLETRRAVSAFQADAGLKQTGDMSDETWQKLQSSSDQRAAEAPSQPGSAQAATPNSSAGAADESPDTAPTASELPAIEGEGNPDVVIADTSEGGIGKIVGLSLGLVALLASFGVGFYMANRSKAEAEAAEDSHWGSIGTNPSARSLTRTDTGLSSTAQPKPALGQGVARSTSNGTAITSTAINSPIQTTGQVGGTMPLAQVDVIEGLIGDLRNPDPTQRRKAIWELGQRGNSLAMQPLVDSMVNADSKEKSLVLAALSEIGIRSLKPMSRALAIALQDDNPEVRKNAIRDLTRVYELVVQISQMLGHATEDEDPEVRQTATWALDQLNRIRRSQDIDSTVRTFTSAGSAAPIDLLSSEASLRRSQQS
ncbi:MAG: peptidoglycan-binding protein [Phormidesmis sp.]